MLLWLLILTFYGAMVAWWGRNLPPALKARVLAVQAAVMVAFAGFTLLTSNPFARQAPPFDGNDLNPLLQDPGLAIHPPFLYLGYVGLSMAFSFAMAALIEGRVDAAWARWVRPWTLLAWVFLTIGIALGSYWAYYELGWGGWWFWDPVENVSFMPWLLSAALLHSAIVVEKRDTLKSWTILLAILAFSFSLIGAFIVRSGVITSVHAFANDPDRGVFLLMILAFFIGGALSLYAWRAPSLRSGSVFAPVSRESGLVLNNLLLVAATFVVLVGTIWPLIAEVLMGRKVSVGAPFFELAFTPFMVALAAILPVFAALPWKRGDLGRAMQPMWGALALAVALGALVWSLQTGRTLLAPDRGGAGGVADSGRGGGARGPGAARAGGVGGVGAAAREPAAVGLGQGDRPCGARRHHLRHRLRQRLADRGHPGDAGRRYLRGGGLRAAARRGGADQRGRTTRRSGPRSPFCATGRRSGGCGPSGGSTRCSGCPPPRRRSTAA